MKKKQYIAFPIYITKEMRDELEQDANELNMTISAYIRYILTIRKGDNNDNNQQER